MRPRRALVSRGVKTVPLPWNGNPIGRCWRVGFQHKTTGIDSTYRVVGNVTFELQPMSKGDQGIIADDFTPEPLKERPGACGAAFRRSYTAREKASDIMRLRELESRSLEVWELHGMSPLQYMPLKTEVPHANISKW